MVITRNLQLYQGKQNRFIYAMFFLTTFVKSNPIIAIGAQYDRYGMFEVFMKLLERVSLPMVTIWVELTHSFNSYDKSIQPTC